MQKSKAIKETLETVISNLEKERDQIQNMIDNVEMRIKKNKDAGNISESSSLNSTEKSNVQKFIKEHLEKEEDSSNSNTQLPTTSAKKLMPKMKEKV